MNQLRALVLGVALLQVLPGGGGGGSSVTNPVSRLTTNTTAVGNVGVGEDDLMSYTLDANKLASDGQLLRVTVGGTLAGNTNSKVVNFYFGAATISIANTATAADIQWRATVYVIRTGATAQIVNGYGIAGSVSEPVDTREGGNVTGAETLSGTVVVKCTGTATANDDIIQTFMIVELVG